MHGGVLQRLASVARPASELEEGDGVNGIAAPHNFTTSILGSVMSSMA